MNIYKDRCWKCNQPILLIKAGNGKTYPCDPEPVEFIPDLNGSKKYITEDGYPIRGADPDPADKDIHSGYVDHRGVCKGKK